MGVPVRNVEGQLPSLPVTDGMDAYYFYSRKSLEEYPWLDRFLIRFLYKRNGWNTDDGSIESQGIGIMSEQHAIALAEREGWGVQRLPINNPLPHETAQYGLNDVPFSSARRRMGVDRDLPWKVISRQTDEHRREIWLKLISELQKVVDRA